MAENRTKATKLSVAKYIAAIANEERRRDCKALVKLMSGITRQLITGSTRKFDGTTARDQMRTHGTLTRWNDDRGFGFITPAKAGADLFVHISAFPRDGVRPRLGELISFKTETGPDGRQRAVRVMRPGQRAAAPPATGSTRHRVRERKPQAALALLMVAGLGAYGYTQYNKQAAPDETPAQEEFSLPDSSPARYSCDGRTMCSQMNSCEEATYFIRNCPNTQMDGDSDGVPCESQWCND